MIGNLKDDEDVKAVVRFITPLLLRVAIIDMPNPNIGANKLV